MESRDRDGKWDENQKEEEQVEEEEEEKGRMRRRANRVSSSQLQEVVSSHLV